MKKLFVVFLAGVAVGALDPHTAFGGYWRADNGMDTPDAPMAIKPPKESKANLQRRISEYESPSHPTPKNSAEWFALGVAYAQAEKPKEATDALRSAIKLQPGNSEAWNWLGSSLIAGGNVDESIDAFRRVVEMDPKSSNGWNNLGLALIRKQQFAEAEEDLRKACALDRASKVAWNSVGALRAAEGNNAGALDAYDRALKIDPNYFRARFNRGLALYMNQNFIGAIDCARRAFRANPEFTRSGVALEIWLADAGNSNEAAAVAKDVLARMPSDPFAWDILGANDITNGRYQEGVDKLGKARSLGCDGTESLRSYVIGLIRLDRVAEAEKIATEAIAADPTNENHLVALGGVRREQKRMEDSCALFRKALEMNPTNISALTYLSQNERDMHQLDESMRHARRVLELDPRNTDGLLLVGAVQEQRKDWASATATYKKATELNPGNAACWQAFARMAPDYATAREAANKALALDPNGSFPQTLAAYLQRKFKKYDEAIASYKDVLRKFPKNATAANGIHDTLFELGRGAEAEAFFREMTRETADSALAWRMLGQARLNLREYPGARDAFLNAANLDSKDQRPLDCLGQIVLDSMEQHPLVPGAPLDPVLEQKGKEAETFLRKAVEIEPRLAYSRALLCEALYFQHRFSEAEEEGQKAVSLDPGVVRGWNSLAGCLYLDQKFSEAANAYEKCLKLEPATFYYWGTMVSCYISAGALPTAEKKVRELVDEYPGIAHGWHFLGAILDAENQPGEEGVQCYLKAISLSKEDHLSWNGLGLIHSKRGDLDQAVECYQKALRQMPGFAESWSNLGYAYFRQGKTAEAIDAYQHALQAQPNHVNALINLAQAAAKIGDMNLARKACDQLAAVNPAIADRTRQRFLR